MPEAVQSAIKEEKDTESDDMVQIDQIKVEETDDTEVKSEGEPNTCSIISKSYVEEFNLRDCAHQDVIKEEPESQEPEVVLELYIGCEEDKKHVQKQIQRERIALQLSQETPEQRNLRREKARLAKASLRAAEPLEKILKRRERDRKAKAAVRAAESLKESILRKEKQRKAKALSRMRETEEQRRMRLEKNRIAVATLRAALSEEEKVARREKDRIYKARIRAFETEEQRRIRREKNRIAVAIKRGNSNTEKSNNERKADCLRKDALKISLQKEILS